MSEAQGCLPVHNAEACQMCAITLGSRRSEATRILRGTIPMTDDKFAQQRAKSVGRQSQGKRQAVSTTLLCLLGEQVSAAGENNHLHLDAAHMHCPA